MNGTMWEGQFDARIGMKKGPGKGKHRRNTKHKKNSRPGVSMPVPGVSMLDGVMETSDL